ncbi:MAG: YceI family protein [Planctomycetaceae bacterium]|jgi:polyisoprenoid-binding protein YceI|nr:YceI family protein [Planctomycetaceae bacterium]
MKYTTIAAASVASALLLAAAPHAQDAAPAPAAAAVAPSAITLDPVHSMAVFRIQHLGAGYFWGRFNELSGSAQWPLDDSAAPSFEVTAQVDKVDTGSAKLDGNLQGPNFFNQAEFPTIVFKSTAARRIGERHYAVTGDLTLRGVTKSIEVDCVVTGIGKAPTGQKVGFECTFTLNRADYGMKWGIDAPKGALGSEVKMVIALEGDVAKPKG